jgi:hypothetical protein
MYLVVSYIYPVATNATSLSFCDIPSKQFADLLAPYVQLSFFIMKNLVGMFVLVALIPDLKLGAPAKCVFPFFITVVTLFACFGAKIQFRWALFRCRSRFNWAHVLSATTIDEERPKNCATYYRQRR